MTAKELGDCPAHPITLTNEMVVNSEDSNSLYLSTRGLTKRELFAAMAMQGLCNQAALNYASGSCNNAIVERAVILADALLASLAKQEVRK